MTTLQSSVQSVWSRSACHEVHEDAQLSLRCMGNITLQIRPLKVICLTLGLSGATCFHLKIWKDELMGDLEPIFGLNNWCIIVCTRNTHFWMSEAHDHAFISTVWACLRVRQIRFDDRHQRSDMPIETMTWLFECDAATSNFNQNKIKAHNQTQHKSSAWVGKGTKVLSKFWFTWGPIFHLLLSKAYILKETCNLNEFI